MEFSGRVIDEKFIADFIVAHELPANKTAAFLTPAFQWLNRPLIVGEDARHDGKEYRAALIVLAAVESGEVPAEDVLVEVTRLLFQIRDARKAALDSLLAGVRVTDPGFVSSEAIVGLVRDHLRNPRSSRLPVLALAAAYSAIQPVAPLLAHNAADGQSVAAGDVNALGDAGWIDIGIEVRDKPVDVNDVEQAVEKAIKGSAPRYLIATARSITDAVRDRAWTLSQQVGDVTDVGVHDPLSLFGVLLTMSKVRASFLDRYQSPIMAEPDSAVGQDINESLLRLRAQVAA